MAGFTSQCCNGSSCRGSPANCYCDMDCFLFDDCCGDVPQSCAPPLAGQGTYLLVATENSIVRVSLDGTRSQVLVSNLARSISIDYFYKYVQYR